MRKRITSVTAIIIALLTSMTGYLGNSALAASPVSVIVLDSPDPVQSGDILMYTWQITNNGGAKVTDVIGTTQVDLSGIGAPPQLVITSDVGTCAQANATVTCNAGTLAGGQTWTVTIRGLVNAPSGTTLNNTVTVTGTKAAQTFSESGSATTLVLGTAPGGDKPDLSIQKVGPAAVAVSSNFSYQLTINNTGTANASNVKVVDNLPAGVTFVAATGTSLFQCAIAAQTLTCDGGNINAGANATITIDVVAPAVTGTIANNAVVDPFNTIQESYEFNNTSATIFTTVTPTPPPPPYTITKVQTSPAYPGYPNVVVPGDIVTYTITATNISGGRSDYNKILDATQGLEASSLSVSATLTGGGAFLECTIGAPNAWCTWTRWPAGASITMIVIGRVIASAGSTIRDTATITGNVQNTGFSATTNLVSVIKPAVDLTITKSDSPDPLCAGSWPPANPALPCTSGLTYTLVIGNSGITPANGVTVMDQLAPGLILDSYSAPAFAGGCSIDYSTMRIFCSGGLIAPESTVTITFTLVAPQTVGTIANTATVDPTNSIFESDETNNVATQATTIITGVDLTIQKVDSPPGFDPIATSGTQTYTITVDNIGPQDATNIRVRDTIPAGSQFISAEGDNGFTCAYLGGLIVECINGHILGTMSEFYDPPGPAGPAGADDATIIIKVFAQPHVGLMHNEVRVDPLLEIPEINESNNFEFEDTVVGTGDSSMGAFNELSIVKTAAPAGVTQNNTGITYALTVTNGGSDPAVNVVVKDYLPALTTFISAWDDTPPGGVLAQAGDFQCTHSAGVVTCTGGTLDGTSMAPNGPLGPDYPTQRIIKIQVTAPNVAYLDAVNQAFVDPDNAIKEGNENNNTSSVMNQVRSFIDLTIKKFGGDSAQQSSPLEYLLEAKNDPKGTAGATAYDVTIHDKLPVGLIVLGAEVQDPNTNDMQCQVQENPVNVVDCVGSIASGATIKIKIKTFVTATNDVKLTNEACIDWLKTVVEIDETNNCAQTQTVIGAPDIAVSKSALHNTVLPGQNQVYTIVATNVGNVDATTVKITDTLESGQTFVSAIATNGFTCSHAAGVVTCENGPSVVLAANGGTTTITLTATVPSSAPTGPLHNAANASTVTPADGNLSNNIGEVTTSIGGAGIDLQLLSAVDVPDPVQEAGVLTWTLNVLNSGTADASGVIIQSSISAGLTSGVSMLNAVASEGFSCTPTGTNPIVISCSRPSGVLEAGHTVTVTITAVVTATTGASITNEVKVDPANAITETVEINNDFTVVTSVVSPSCPPSPPADPCIDLVTGQLLASADPVNVGDPITYTATVTNTGNVNTTTVGPSPNVYVQIDVPTQVTYTTGSISASSGFSCTEAFLPSLFCFGDLAAASGVVMSFSGVVNSSGSNSITATATVDPFNFVAEFDESVLSNSSSVTITRN